MANDRVRQEIADMLADGMAADDIPRAMMNAGTAADINGETWWHEWRDADTESSLARIVKVIRKQMDTVLVDYKGRKVTKSTRVGIIRKKADGTTGFQQLLFHESSWAEIDAWAGGIGKQVAGLEANLVMYARLKELQDAMPESEGPAEAAAALGTTVDEWLQAG